MTGGQAARLDGASIISVPSRNVAPATIFGNWFSPFSLRQVFEAAITSLKTISRAVDGDYSDALVLTVLCRTVANTLSMGFEVRR